MTESAMGEITLRTVPLPAGSNASGHVFGGWLMSRMDLGASVLARGRLATVAADFP